MTRAIHTPRVLAATMALALLVLAGCNPPPPRDHIRFAHGPHLAHGMNCVRCHAEASHGSDAGTGAVEGDAGEAHPHVVLPEEVHAHSATRPLLPAESDCRDCHTDPVRDGCPRCHTEPQRAERYADREDDIRFDHAAHDAPSHGRCVRCHRSESETEATYAPTRPPMSTCTSSCHREDMAALDCERCHTDLHRYRIADVALIDHGPGFLRRHGAAAGATSALCTQCHDPSFCEDCHLSAQGLPLELLTPTAQYRDFVHRGDFFARHGVESGLERSTCLRCHGVSFCDGCHQASGVGGGVAPGSPHPPGWLDPASPFGHARAARRDLMGCVSCHEADAETTCVPCHRVGGVAGNPHPPGFGGGMDPLAVGVCRACHVTR